MRGMLCKNIKIFRAFQAKDNAIIEALRSSHVLGWSEFEGNDTLNKARGS
jgi:hypothetical protein